jgi:hypothetical protein
MKKITWEWIKWKFAIGWDFIRNEVERDPKSDGDWGWQIMTWRNRKTGEYRVIKSSYGHFPLL